MSQANVLLQVQDLRVAYGGIQAVKGVSFEVREGELVSLIGSNGAGKTTTMKAITGSLQAAGGRISYLGRDVHGQGPWDLVQQGLVMVPLGYSGSDAVVGGQWANSEVIFRAVSPSDAENIRMRYERGADHHQVIEIRKR